MAGIQNNNLFSNGRKLLLSSPEDIASMQEDLTVAEILAFGYPEGVVSAQPGSLCRDYSDDSVGGMYIKVTGIGNTNWNSMYHLPQIVLVSEGPGVPLTPNRSYIVQQHLGDILELPNDPEPGSIIEIVSLDTITGSVILTFNDGFIRIGSVVSTAGNGVQTTGAGDSVRLTYDAFSSGWVSIGSNGTWANYP